MKKLISFHKVFKFYEKLLILNDINFDLYQNTITTIIGPNGAGKTSLAKLALNLIIPSSGLIKHTKSLKIGYVPQKLFLKNSLPITAKNFLKLLVPICLIDNELKEIIDNFSKINQIQNQDISSLSGGQLQKLLIAAAFLSKPDFVVFDEPTKGLDFNSQQQFFQLIKYYKYKTDLTILMVSHDLHIVMKTSDQVICLNQHICCSGKPKDLKNNQIFIDSFHNIGFYHHHHNHTH